MFNFRQYNISKNTNSSIHHLEETIILGGKRGSLNCIFALKSMRDMLIGDDVTESVDLKNTIEVFDGDITLTKEESDRISGHILHIISGYNKLDVSFFESLNDRVDCQKYFISHLDHIMKFPIKFDSFDATHELTESMLAVCDTKIGCHVAGTTSYKKYKYEKDLLEIFFSENKGNINTMFEMYNHTFIAKSMIINKLNKLNEMDTLARTKHGFRVVGHDGFVIINEATNETLKVVDRIEFKTTNYSPETVKGWDLPKA